MGTSILSVKSLISVSRYELRKKGVRRLVKRLPVSVREIVCYTTNFSCEGMQLACPAMRLFELKKELDIRSMYCTIHLPEGHDSNVNCRITYVSQYGEEYLVGLQYTQFVGRGRGALENYIAQHAAPEYVSIPAATAR